MPPVWVYILLASVLVTMFILTDLLISRPLPQTTVRMHEVERAYAISLEDKPDLAESVARQLHVPNVTLWPAVNASVAPSCPSTRGTCWTAGDTTTSSWVAARRWAAFSATCRVGLFPGSLLALSLVLGFTCQCRPRFCSVPRATRRGSYKEKRRMESCVRNSLSE